MILYYMQWLTEKSSTKKGTYLLVEEMKRERNVQKKINKTYSELEKGYNVHDLIRNFLGKKKKKNFY